MTRQPQHTFSFTSSQARRACSSSLSDAWCWWRDYAPSSLWTWVGNSSTPPMWGRSLLPGWRNPLLYLCNHSANLHFRKHLWSPGFPVGRLVSSCSHARTLLARVIGVKNLVNHRCNWGGDNFGGRMLGSWRTNLLINGSMHPWPIPNLNRVGSRLSNLRPWTRLMMRMTSVLATVVVCHLSPLTTRYGQQTLPQLLGLLSHSLRWSSLHS